MKIGLMVDDSFALENSTKAQFKQEMFQVKIFLRMHFQDFFEGFRVCFKSGMAKFMINDLFLGRITESIKVSPRPFSCTTSSRPCQWWNDCGPVFSFCRPLYSSALSSLRNQLFARALANDAAGSLKTTCQREFRPSSSDV